MSLDIALRHARLNPVKGLPPMAAVIMDGNKIVSVGLNARKTHPLAAKFGKHDKANCLHAELSAIVNARCNIKGMTMYVARAHRKTGEAMLAKPCKGCARAILAFNLGDVEWTN